MRTPMLCLCAALTLAFPVDLRAQDAPRDTLLFRVSPLIVDAIRPRATSGGASAVELPLRPWRQPAASLDQVARDLPFIQVRTNARGEGYFGIRGSGQEAREAAVLLDGVPLSLGFDHRADLALIPMSGAQSVTLVRGLPSLLYGPNVLGGVVEVSLGGDSEAGSTARRAWGAAGVDHTGARAMSAAVTAPVQLGAGTLALRAGGGHRSSDGFVLPRGIAQPDGDDLRTNSDNSMSDGFFSARYSPRGAAWAAVTASGHTGSRGAPAELDFANPRYWRYPVVRRLLATLAGGSGHAASPLGGSGEIRGSLAVQAARSELDGFTDGSYATVADQEDADDRTLTGRVVASQSLGSRGRLDAAATFADVSRDERLTPGTAATYRQRLWSGALESAWRLPAPGAGSLTATVGAAWDAADTPESGDKPAVAQLTTWGARVGLVAATGDGNLLLHAGASRRARFPSLRELYSGALNRVEPNPDLGPEFLRAVEGGVTARFGGGQLQLVGFHHRIEDAIVRTMVNRRVKRVNRDETRSTGLELLAARSFAGATLSLDLTAQNVTSTDPTADADFRPEYQPKFAGGIAVAAPFLFGSSTEVTARGTGSQYCLDQAGYRRLAPEARAGVAVSRTWQRLTVLAGVDNVTDSLGWDQCGLPRPGRTFRLSLAVR